MYLLYTCYIAVTLLFHTHYTPVIHSVHRLYTLVFTEDVDVDVEGTDFLLGDLEWSTSSDSDERGSLRSSCSDEGYSSASLRHLANTQEKNISL